MFQFGRFPASSYVFAVRWYAMNIPGFPIRTFTAQSLFAAPRDFSQLIASFFGSWRQGIRPVLFLAWILESREFSFLGLTSNFQRCLGIVPVQRLPFQTAVHTSVHTLRLHFQQKFFFFAFNRKTLYTNISVCVRLSVSPNWQSLDTVISSSFHYGRALPAPSLGTIRYLIWSISASAVLSQIFLYLLVFIRFSMCILFCQLKFENFLLPSYTLNSPLAWWAQVDSNHRPCAYQAHALTTWAMSPYYN